MESSPLSSFGRTTTIAPAAAMSSSDQASHEAQRQLMFADDHHRGDGPTDKAAVQSKFAREVVPFVWVFEQEVDLGADETQTRKRRTERGALTVS